MNSVAPSRARQRAAALRPAPGQATAAAPRRGSAAPPAAGRSVGSSSSGGSAGQPPPPVGELPLQHLALQPARAARPRSRRTAPAAPASGDGRPARRRRRARRARASGPPCDQPSLDDVVQRSAGAGAPPSPARSSATRSSGPAAEVEGAPGLGSARRRASAAPLAPAGAAGRRPAARTGAAGAITLHRLAVDGRERRAQDLVAAHELGERAARSAATSSGPVEAERHGML